MPHVEVVKPTPQPRSRRDQTPGGEDTSGLPSYSHMIVTDGQLEPHNYAIVRLVSVRLCHSLILIQ